MKLATLPGPTRDGRLALVDDRARRVLPVPAEVAPDLRRALEDWARIEPRLRQLDADLKAGRASNTLPLDEAALLAPLPRTTSWLDASAFIQHILLVRKARNAQPPEDLRTVPLMYQGVGDPVLPATADIPVTSEDYGTDLEAEVAVILDDTPMGTPAASAGGHIKLLALMNDVSLRNLITRELATQFGFFHGKPPSSLGPFAVTPDELGPAWRDGRVHLPIHTKVNGQWLGHPDCGEMFFSFPQLIEHAAKTRPLPAGTVLGSGTVSNADESRGCGCLAERRTLETIHKGKPETPFLRFGDRVRIEVLHPDGRSVFGAIDQRVVKA